jgi:hypothetical protein
MRVPMALWQLLSPLDDAERRYVVDTVFQGVPPDQGETEIRRLWSALPQRPTAANGRPGSVRLAELDGVTVSHAYLDIVRVTLFEFAPPEVDGCKIITERSVSKQRSSEWSLAFPGAKGSTKSDVKTTFRSTFSASAGERKRVFVNLPTRVTRVFELKDGILRPTGMVHVEQPRHTRASGTPAPGIESIPAEQPPLAHLLETYPLAGDRTVTPAEYEYTYEERREVSAHVGGSVDLGPIRGVSVGESLTVGISVTVKLKLVLAPGHNYEMYAIENGHGIGWRFT